MRITNDILDMSRAHLHRRPAPGLRRAAASIVVLAALLAVTAGVTPAHAAFWDPDATPVWANYENGAGDTDDYAMDVKLTGGGVTYVAGTVTNAQGNTDISLGKYLAGVSVWGGLKTYNGAAHGDDFAKKMALGPGGVVYVTGPSTSGAGNADLVVVKWSGKTGKRLWVRRYDGPKHLADAGSAIGVDRRGNVTVAGYSYSGNGQDVFVRSWSASGKVRWSWRYDGVAHGPDSASDLYVAGDGSVYVSAVVRGVLDATTSLTARFSSLGKKKWMDLYTGPDNLEAAAGNIAARPGGGVYVAGWARTTTMAYDGLVVAYRADGTRSVFALNSGATDQGFNDVAVTSGGDVVAVGYSVVAGHNQPRRVRYDPLGVVQMSATVPTSGSDEYTAVATDAYGGYYPTGTNTNGVGDMRVETRRLSTVVGGGSWVSEVLPHATPANRPTAIAVRGTTVVVVGQTDTGLAADDDQFLFTYVY